MKNRRVSSRIWKCNHGTSLAFRTHSPPTVNINHDFLILAERRLLQLNAGEVFQPQEQAGLSCVGVGACVTFEFLGNICSGDCIYINPTTALIPYIHLSP